MRNLIALLLILVVAMPLLAQEDEGAMQGPPPPLEDEFMSWMHGKWEGTDVSSMGESKVTMACKAGLNGQFMLMEYHQTSAMGEFTGMAAMTLNHEGGIDGFWIDSMRDMATGKGTREGDVVTMNWEGKHGKMTRHVKKAGADEIVEEWTWTGHDGQEMEGKLTMSRVKMTDKSY